MKRNPKIEQTIRDQGATHVVRGPSVDLYYRPSKAAAGAWASVAVYGDHGDKVDNWIVSHGGLPPDAEVLLPTPIAVVVHALREAYTGQYFGHRALARYTLARMESMTALERELRRLASGER
jgi:hypothetical protein